MSDKFYVGKDLVSYSDNGTYKPVSRVTLLLDDENCVTSGDDTGFELVADCPYATQVMADALLASFVGYEYKAYKAVAVNIDPSAELGDGLTADDNYVVISRVDDDGNGYPTLSAVGEAEMEDEYPSTGPMTQKFDRQLAQTRSAIEKSAEAIKLIVEELGGSYENYTELELNLDGVFVRDETGATRITGSCIETDTLYVDAAHISGKLVANQIDATDLVLTNSANIANNFIVDSSGNVTMKGNINLSGGSITWGSNYPGGDSGYTESEIKTFISEELVASPTIMGGKFYDLGQSTVLNLGENITGNYVYPGLVLTSVKTGVELFAVGTPIKTCSIVNIDILGDTAFVKYEDTLSFATNLAFFSGITVDFSNATVTGFTAVWG